MSETGSRLEDLKILIVDDQPDTRGMIRNMLLELGVTQTFETPNGLEAFKFIDSAFDFVDLIICDWNMPEMTGVELLRKIRASDPNVPFLMITGRGDVDSVVEAKSSGVSAYVRKPFSPPQLEAKIRIIAQKFIWK